MIEEQTTATKVEQREIGESTEEGEDFETDELLTKLTEDELLEQSLERSLSDAEGRLRFDPQNESNIIFTGNTLIGLKNFLYKYGMKNQIDPTQEIRVIERVLTRYEDDPYRYISQFNAYIFPILGPQKYKFGLKYRKEKPWKKKILENMQIEEYLPYDSPIFETSALDPTDHENKKLRQYCYISSQYMKHLKSDQLTLYGGFRRQGKSTLALWDLLYKHEFRGESITKKNVMQWLKYDVIYTEADDLRNRIMKAENDIIRVDEGYFTVFKEETMKWEVRELAKNINAVASRQNDIGICMSELSDATLPIQKLTLTSFWIEVRGHANLYCKDKSWQNPKDPLGFDAVNKATYKSQRDWRITHTQYYITRMDVAPLPDWIYSEYANIKKSKQEEKGELDVERRLNRSLDEKLINLAIKAYAEGHIDIKAWLMGRDVPKKVALKMEREIMERIYRDKILKDEGIIESGNVEVEQASQGDAI